MKLYKYLPRKYLSSVLNEGAFLFRSLSYFQDYEDELIRGDEYEGILKHEKSDGIEINNLSTGRTSKEPWKFISKVDSENIFIFCTSMTLSHDLAKEFKSDICIEFLKPANVISKLHSAVSRRKRIKPNKLFHSKVEYYGEEEAPGIRWAFPNEIAMRKLNAFTAQEEYRFMFSLNGALDFGKTSQELKIGENHKSQRDNPYPEHVLKIGNIKINIDTHRLQA